MLQRASICDVGLVIHEMWEVTKIWVTYGGSLLEGDSTIWGSFSLRHWSLGEGGHGRDI